MLDAKLHVKLGNWQRFIARRSDKRFKSIEKTVLARDQNTCQFCGFQAFQYQQIVNRDHNYANYKKENLVTACPFCAQCFFLEEVGRDGMSGGQVIYLPEMSQGQLSALCHVLFCAMGNTTEYTDSAQTLYRSLRFRAQPVEQRYGEGTSNPAVLGRVLLEYKMSNPDFNPMGPLADLRLLPLQTKFKKQLKAWAEAAAQELEEQAKS